MVPVRIQHVRTLEGWNNQTKFLIVSHGPYIVGHFGKVNFFLETKMKQALYVTRAANYKLN